MIGYYGDIEKLTRENENFREVLFTGNHSQLVLMTLQPKEDIGVETHHENDQFFRIEEGEGKIIVEDHEYYVKDGDAVVVPSGTEHNVINVSDTLPLKLYTIYSPAHHPDGTIHVTKSEAEAGEEDHDMAEKIQP